MSCQRASQRGFTLIELLVALGIVAVLAILSWQGLEEVLRLARRLDAKDLQLQQTQAVFAQMERDLSQVERGSQTQGAQPDGVSVSGAGLQLNTTVRNENRAAYKRETLWAIQDNFLIRITRLPQDPASVQTSDPLFYSGMSVRLWLEGIGWTTPTGFGVNAALNFSTPEYQGQRNPLNAVSANQPGLAADTGSENDQRALVRAVEVTLTLPNGQAVRQILKTGGLY
ncbi:MAG: prepilin-type N-terminal cleavage/methylation domain-containing protein [Limnobacter sp.]|nr:prepilin-type N-terminal cleavage/methylation domain-containing protein [Limnobacter sp.]